MDFNTNKSPFFSIIVPVYNTNESYLKTTIESVINQSFKDYELIIIDDCSTVNYKIKNYNNIKYIKNETNKGTLYSRKIGAINSKGKYIIYLDSDDYLSNNALQVIYNSVKDNEIDIIHFSVKAVSTNKNKKEKIKEEKEVQWYLSSARSVINENYLFNETLSTRLPHNMCGKAFKSEIVKKALLYLPDTHLIYSEDMLQSLITIYFAKSYKSIYQQLYICNMDIGYSNKDISKLTVERFEKSCSDVKICLNEFYNFLCSQKIEILHYYDFLRLYYNQYKFLLNKSNGEKLYLDILNKYFDKELIEEYNEFEKFHQYYLTPLHTQEEINKKLLPYFFSIIIYSCYIRIRIFGISINLKTNKCYKKPVVISFSNLLRNIFSISLNKNEKLIRIFGLKFYIDKGANYER